ncbi:MAG: hypothetical protein ACREEV_10160 [Dongiaceae bacterium]
MQYGLWRRAVSTCLAGLILGSGSVFAERAAAEEGGLRLPNAACDDIDLRVGAAVGEQSCRAASISDADARARAEVINALGAGSIFLAEYINAGMHTYVHRSTPREIAEKTGLEKARGEEETRFHMQGFDVWRFKATAGMHCASFAKHWSRVSRTPGYRHRIIGVYCSQRESDVADARLDQVFASIEPTE